MRRSIALTSVAGVFLIGALTGALGMHLHDVMSARSHARSRVAAHHDHLAALLDLTPEQKQNVERILQDSQPQARALHEEMLPRVHAHMRRIHDRIHDVLTPDQRKKFAELEHHDRGLLERFMLAHPTHGDHH